MRRHGRNLGVAGNSNFEIIMQTETKQTHTAGEWLIDDGMVDMQSQARMLIDDVGTDRQWVAVGIADRQGFAEVIALTHPCNAPIVAASPDLYEACKAAASNCRFCKGTGKFKQSHPMKRDEHGELVAGDREMDCTLCAPYRSAIAKAEGRQE